MATASYAEYTTRNEVRRDIETANWQVVWGITINEGEYAKFTLAIAASIAAENPTPIYKYFDDYLNRTIDKVLRNAPEIGLNALHNLIVRAFDNRGRIFRNGRLEVSAGIATYRRWDRVVYDEPRTYKCKQKSLNLSHFVVRKIWSLNLSYFVARKIWPRRCVSPLCGRAHRLQRRKPLRCLRVPMDITFDLLQTAIN
jgi:hypothetical protein